MNLEFTVQVKSEEVAAITDRIATIQGKQQSVVDEKPQRKE
jgi:hypothetical protein